MDNPPFRKLSKTEEEMIRSLYEIVFHANPHHVFRIRIHATSSDEALKIYFKDYPKRGFAYKIDDTHPPIDHVRLVKDHLNESSIRDDSN